MNSLWLENINFPKLQKLDKNLSTDVCIIGGGITGITLGYKLKKENILPHKIEGYNSNSWILMDYLDVIVNIFTETDREHYKLEDLWEKLN